MPQYISSDEVFGQTGQGKYLSDEDVFGVKPKDQKKRRDVPEMTVGSVAQDIAAGVLQIGPTAVKGVADIARLATGDRVGTDTSEAMQRGMDSIREVVGSERAATQRDNLQRDMTDDAVGIGETLMRNKGALADQLLPTVGSMFLPVGVAGAAGKLATAGKTAEAMNAAQMAQRVATVQKAAGIGSVAAQNAADTFSELLGKGASMEDAYLGAGITVPFSVVAGALTGGGAEAAITKALTQSGAIKTGVKQFGKAAAQEGAQEMGEEAGQIAGEAVGMDAAPSAMGAAKQLAVAGSLGAVMGGGVDVGSQARQLGRGEQPTQNEGAPIQGGDPITSETGTPPATAPATPPAQRGAPITPQSATDPTARLAELEILAEQRELLPAERQEVAELLTALDAQDGQDATQTTHAGPANGGRAPQQAQATEATTPKAGDAVGATGVSAAAAAAPVEAAGVSAAAQGAQPASLGLLAGSAAPQEDAAQPAAVFKDFWSFAKSKGFAPSQIKVGTPEHVALKAEFDMLKAPVAEPALPSMQPQQDVNLQNRDRGRAASVVQMSELARNPDYMRLGPSRSPDSGAPMVFAVGDQMDAIEPQNFGREDVAVMSDGQRVPFRYAVVDASKVNPSNFADGRQNPDFNSTTPGTVKALNNGRSAGIRAAHEMGSAGEYVSGMQADDAIHGIPPDVIARTPNPMLVRVYSDANNTAGMAAKSQGQGLGMSPAELARQDAPLLDSGVLDAYQDGDVTSAANRDFVRAFVGKLQGAGQDVAGMMTSEGQLSQDGRKRIQAALMQAAYGDSDIVEEMFDSTDTDIKAIGEALKAVAGQWANMRDSAKLGTINPQVDITQNLLQAVGLIRKARRDSQSLYQLVNQPDLMTGETPDPMTVALLRLFYSGHYLTRAIGRERLAQSLSDYVGRAMVTSADAGLFGEVVTPMQILETITLAKGANDAKTQPQESPGQPAGGNAAGVGVAQVEPGNERPAAGEGRAATDADRAGEPGQDANAQGRQQTGQSLQGAEEGDGATEGRADGGQPRDATEPIAPAEPVDQAQGLIRYTPQDIEGRLARLQQAERERQQQDREAEQRAQADAERDTFTLTGSDRPADVAAAQGQGDIFRAAPEPQTQTGDAVTWRLANGKMVKGVVVRVNAGTRGGATVRVTGAEAGAGVAAGGVFNVPLEKLSRQETVPPEAAQSPNDFIPAPDGGLDYGEITPDMAKAMRRQAGKIRLTRGVQNADDTGHGLVHIEARHGKEIRAAGFDSVEAFLKEAFQSIDEVWKPGKTTQLIAVQSGRTGKVAFIQLEADSQGGEDFYRVNSAFPANEKYVARKEKKEGWKPLWSRYPVPADASGASGFVGQSPEAGETTPTVSGQSGEISVPAQPDAGKPAEDTRLSRGAGLPAGRVDYEALKKMTFRIRSKNPGMPPVLVLDDPSQAPKGLREYIVRQDAWHDVEGAMHEGQLFLFASGLTDLTRAEHVLLEHEGAHFGLRAMLGDSLKTAMALVYANNADVRRAAFELQKRGKLSNTEAVEEVIVDIPTSKLIKLKGWRKVTVMARDWLQAHGFTNLADKLTAWLDGSLTQQERADLFVAELVRGAREYIAGKRPRRRGVVVGDTRLSTTLAEDIERQDQWLKTEARARGFNDIEDLMAKDYPLFEKLATKWREKNPASEGVMLSRSSDTKAAFESRIDTLFTGGKAKTGTKVLDSSDMMGLLGYAQVPLVLNERHLMDGMTTHPELTAQAWKRVPGWIENPAAAYLSMGQGNQNRVVLLAPELLAGYPVVMVIEPNPGVVGGRAGQASSEQLLVTVFAKTNGTVPLANAAKQGKLLYLQKEMAPAISSSGGVQFPKHGDITTGRKKILTEKNLAGFIKARQQGEADVTGQKETPGTTDFETIKDRIVPSYAQSDTGDVRIVYPNGGDGQVGPTRLSRAPSSKTATERIDEAQTLMQSEPAKRPGMVERGKQAAGELVDSLRDKDARLELLDTVTQKLQDRFVDLKWLQGQIAQSGGTLTEMNDAYRGEELYHGRAATAQDVFLRDELKPVLEQMQRAGIGLEQMEAYLHAQHAPEANAELAKRNLNEAQLEEKRAAMDAQVKDLVLALQRAMAAGTATQPIERALVEARAERSQWRSAQAFVGSEAERTSLSGMSDGEAAAIMAAVPDAKRAAYEALAKKVGAIIASTRDMQVKAGLITQAQANEWANLYAHYVPLHRDEAHPASRIKMGQGFSVKGKESRSRTGSQAKVTNILAHVAAQREQAITRGEKNLVAKRLWLLAAQNPMPDVWTLEKPKSSHVDAQTGLVVSGVDPNYLNKPNVLVVKIAGKDHAIVFNERNERAMRLVGELKNLDAPTLDGVTRTAAKMTRWLASVNTQYNPVFGVINFARDVQAAGLQLSTTALDGKQREVMQGSFSAFGSIWRAERGKAPKNKADAELAALWKEMQAAGGMTGYRDVFANIEDRVKALDKMLAENDRGKVAKFGAAGLDVLSDYNTAMEGAVRLSAYKQAKAMGLSVSDAASLAKNLTVNFNRKGTVGRSAAPWFAFFNAAVQGSTRMIQTLRGPMGKRIMAGGVLLGMVTSLLSMAMMGGGGDDDEDKDKQTPWQKIPDFVKERSLILGWGEDYIAVPMPLGYNLFTNAGRVLAEQLAGQGRPGKGVGDALVDVLSMAVGAFNPVGGSDLASAVTPTPADWAVDLLRNKDWTGRDIAREDTNKNDPTPGHSRAKDSATPWAKAISRGANWVTGGTEYQPGVWSPTPDQIDYVIGQLTGGVGRELGKLATTVASPFDADELPANKIPLLSRVYGNTRSPQSGADLFYENVKKANELENEIVGRRKAGESLDGVPDYAFEVVGRGNLYETHVRKLRQVRKHLVQEGADGYKERVKEIEVRIGGAMDDFNRDVNRARRLDAQRM